MQSDLAMQSSQQCGDQSLDSSREQSGALPENNLETIRREAAALAAQMKRATAQADPPDPNSPRADAGAGASTANLRAPLGADNEGTGQAPPGSVHSATPAGDGSASFFPGATSATAATHPQVSPGQS